MSSEYVVRVLLGAATHKEEGANMPTTSAVGRGHSDAANRSTGATHPLFAGHVCPRPTAEAPAGPARRARRASPRPTPVRALALFCLLYTAPAHAPDKMDGPP